ncbi:MAG: hypothetical protein HYX53_03520 [Chloroflexi bacterium]|nr:hypothetical protein [Chloroflexota bacterium]
MLFRVLVAAAASLAAVSALLFAASFAAAADPALTNRVALPMVAADGYPASNLPPLPSPDPAYCPPPNIGSTPPNSVIGTLTIGGAPAPAGTIVQMVLGGKLGLASRTAAAGGYRVDYWAGAAGCSNESGAAIGVLVNGQVFDSGVKIGDVVGKAQVFNIAVP